LLAAAALVLPSAAQQAAPNEFQAAYNEVSTAVARSTLIQGWDGSLYPVYFGAELSPASAYASVLQSGFYDSSVAPFLNALQGLGSVKVVKVLLHFPLLYPKFYTSWPASGGMAAYNARLAFYRRLVADLHARGIRIVIQSMAQGTGDAATIAADPLDLADYYKTLTFSDYVAGRAEQSLAICRLIQPDYLNFDSEPDTEGAKSLQAALDPANQTQFLANNLTLVTAIRDAIVNANPPVAGLHRSVRLAIGMGSWERYLPDVVKHFTGLDGIDVVDVHVHPINATAGADYLANIGTIADAAIAAGKSVGMDETWLDHESAAEIGKVGAPAVDSRNNWGFWAPVDVPFLTLMMNYANYKRMEYVSFAWPQVFFSYLDYANTPGCATPPSSVCTTDQWNRAANTALAAALGAKPVPLTVTGKAFQSLLAAQAAAPAPAATVSAASLRGTAVAPDSLVSIFGAHLATGQAAAQGLPLPTELGGTTATIRDSVGKQSPMVLLLASPGQVNAYIPPGVVAGPASIAIRAGDGAASTSPVTIAAVAPGIFTAGASNVANGLAVKRGADGTQTVVYTAQCAATCSAAPLDLGAAGDTAALVLFGTGIRGADPASVTATVGGRGVSVLYSGTQQQYPGLDQVNLALPQSLAGSGTVTVQITAGGMAANAVTIAIR
jgi:uncharacterized protein (TIGR03437 family)